MGAKGLKICKACHKSFEPQLSDADMRDLWYEEEELERDREHAEASGHSHLEEPPYQELCMKCSKDPDVEVLLPGPFGGETLYRKRRKAASMKKLRVQDVQAQTEHRVMASDGTEMTLTGGSNPPPQEIVDLMREASKGFEEALAKRDVQKMGEHLAKEEAPKPPEKRPLWRIIFRRKKKDGGV